MGFKRLGPTISVCLLLVLYTVGVAGFITSYRGLMLSLTPINLLLSSSILTLSAPRIDKSFLYFLLASYAIGFSVEVLGVHTGLLFGDYHYGETLGFKLFGVPLIIGLNWFLLAYASASLVDYLKVAPIMKALLASLLMVGIDLLIEPLAMPLDFWHWEGGHIPIWNYLGWFLIAFLLQLLFRKWAWSNASGIAASLYLILFSFFLILNLLI